MVRGRLHQRQKSRDSRFTKDRPGGTPLCSQYPIRKGNPPFTSTTEEGWRDGQWSIYQPVSRRREVERRVGIGERSEPVRLGSVPWLEYERWSKAGVLRSWAQLGQQQRSRSGFSTLDSARAAAL